MPEETKLFNYSVSTQRYQVERSFGGLKKHFRWSRSIIMGLQKTAGYLFMGAIAFNLKRSLKILRAWDRRGLPRSWEQSQKWLHKRGTEGLKHKIDRNGLFEAEIRGHGQINIISIEASQVYAMVIKFEHYNH